MTYYRPENLRPSSRIRRYPAATMPAGTIVLTLRGALPVEDIHLGDRVCTRSGASPVKRVHTYDQQHFTLEFDEHQTVYVLGDHCFPHYTVHDDSGQDSK
ncbi:hypothetical protein [Actibacterium sp. MT2.3-13A]|uniref:hypothetical protein n=1 Tax=Actibacterium sp. MT2.3-13A TaxID=2828332 RepID=UPI001BA46569|nr:hypothetical protein [Actibacterium sp. MT2.3-13A]